MGDIKREQLAEMGNQWLRMQFVTREKHFGRLFSEIPIIYYISLISLQNRLGMGREQERLYLRQICEEMDLPMTRVSRMVQGMQDMGYVYWRHDEEENPGTYITLSESGKEAMERQEAKIADFFREAISEYGEEQFRNLLEMRSNFNDTMEKILGGGTP